MKGSSASPSAALRRNLERSGFALIQGPNAKLNFRRPRNPRSYVGEKTRYSVDPAGHDVGASELERGEPYEFPTRLTRENLFPIREKDLVVVSG